MKTNKLLILIQDMSLIKKINDQKINYCFPLKNYSVGFNNFFSMNEIPNDSFIFINKIMDNKDIKNLKNILNTAKKIKGIIFDDLGVLDLIKNKNCEKILFMNHHLNNFESINYMLDYVDSVFISTDITKEETDIILSNAKKDLCVYGFGLVNIMYSKRNLLTNYFLHHQLNIKHELKICVDDKKLLAMENESGTVIYDTPFLYNMDYMDNEKVKYVFINTLMLTNDDIIKIIEQKPLNVALTDGFLYQKTIYKLKGGE